MDCTPREAAGLCQACGYSTRFFNIGWGRILDNIAGKREQITLKSIRDFLCCHAAPANMLGPSPCELPHAEALHWPAWMHALRGTKHGRVPSSPPTIVNFSNFLSQIWLVGIPKGSPHCWRFRRSFCPGISDSLFRQMRGAGLHVSWPRDKARSAGEGLGMKEFCTLGSTDVGYFLVRIVQFFGTYESLRLSVCGIQVDSYVFVLVCAPCNWDIAQHRKPIFGSIIQYHCMGKIRDALTIAFRNPNRQFWTLLDDLGAFHFWMQSASLARLKRHACGANCSR